MNFTNHNCIANSLAHSHASFISHKCGGNWERVVWQWSVRAELFMPAYWACVPLMLFLLISRPHDWARFSFPPRPGHINCPPHRWNEDVMRKGLRKYLLRPLAALHCPPASNIFHTAAIWMLCILGERWEKAGLKTNTILKMIVFQYNDNFYPHEIELPHLCSFIVSSFYNITFFYTPALAYQYDAYLRSVPTSWINESSSPVSSLFRPWGPPRGYNEPILLASPPPLSLVRPSINILCPVN